MITTSTTSIFLDDDGLLHVISNGSPSTESSVTETFDAARTLVSRPTPTLFDARKWPVAGPEFWVTFIDLLPSAVSAGAVLIEPDQAAGLGGFPRAVNRLMVPFEVFTDELEAVAFLKRFVRAPGDDEEE